MRFVRFGRAAPVDGRLLRRVLGGVFIRREPVRARSFIRFRVLCLERAVGRVFDILPRRPFVVFIRRVLRSRTLEARLVRPFTARPVRPVAARLG